MDIDLLQLPIPNWGLVCPTCGYPLRGLPEHRCPECGDAFNIVDLIRPWTRLRDPRFTGRELPFPDLGLTCTACGAPLAGAQRRACPRCQTPFDPQTLRPPWEWFILDAELCRGLPIPAVQELLAAECVPCIPVTEKTLGEIYGGQSITINRLRVPSEFYFEILWLIRQAREEMAAARAAGPGAEWKCTHCGAKNPANFEICWNCEDAKNPQPGR